MKKIDIKWSTLKNISIREVADDCGYNITKNDKVRKDAAKPTVQAIISRLDKKWKPKYKYELTDEYEGIYVISLGDNLAIEYEGEEDYTSSHVLYIGIGGTRNRLRSHLTDWLIDLSTELNDVKLTFHFSEHKYYKEAESLLLTAFQKEHGDFPLKNKINGIKNVSDYTLSKKTLEPIRPKDDDYKWILSPREPSIFLD